MEEHLVSVECVVEDLLLKSLLFTLAVDTLKLGVTFRELQIRLICSIRRPTPTAHS